MVAVAGRRQLGLEEGEVGAVVRGDVPLDAVEQVVLAVPARGGLDRVDVGARALLGDRVALLPLPRDRRAGRTGRSGPGWPRRAARTAGWPPPSRARWSPGPSAPGPAPAAARCSHRRRVRVACSSSAGRVRGRVWRARPSRRRAAPRRPVRPHPRTGSARPRTRGPGPGSADLLPTTRTSGGNLQAAALTCQPLLTECSVYASIGPVPMTDTADAVVVGGGTVGAWCAYFLRRAGLARVVLIEKGFLGQGASSRAAGVVRVQGGTPEAVRLSQLVPAVLPGPAGRDRHRLRVHRAGLPAALLHRGGRRRGPRADGDADRAGRPGAVAGPGRGGRGQPDARARADARRHLLRPGRVRRAAAQRGRLHGGADPQRRRGPRARRLPRPGRRRRGTVRDQPGPDRRGPGRAHRRAEARRGRPAGRACASRPAASGTRSR